MVAPNDKKYFVASLLFHVAIIACLVLGFDFATPLPVVENSNKNDIISAVVLGDTPNSKILPQKQPPPAPAVISKPIVKNEPKQAIPPVPLKKAEIALKTPIKKKPNDLFAKDLLADIQKQTEKQKKLKQAQLKTHFEKALREQAEKSLRQQLLKEEVKLQGTQSRQAQGQVDKYKALIIQAISEHWIIPLQANKKLYCELMIRVAPGGMVLDVQVTKTSGDPSLDSSARAAVLKASPLPVPVDASAFEAFRQFQLKVKPENILNTESPLAG